jgi:hypothetical protein
MHGDSQDMIGARVDALLRFCWIRGGRRLAEMDYLGSMDCNSTVLSFSEGGLRSFEVNLIDSDFDSGRTTGSDCGSAVT